MHRNCGVYGVKLFQKSITGDYLVDILGKEEMLYIESHVTWSYMEFIISAWWFVISVHFTSIHWCWQPFASENSLLIKTLTNTRNVAQILTRSWFFCLARGPDLFLSLSVTTTLITSVMGINWPGNFGKVCFGVLNSIGFQDLVRLFSSLKRSDRFCLGWFFWDLAGSLFEMEASRRSVKTHKGSRLIGSSLSTGFQVYLS